MTSIRLHICDAQRFNDYTLRLARKTAKEGIVIYVSVNRPASTISELWRNAGIDQSRLFIIDCSPSHNKDGIPNCVYLNSPQDLTDIGIAISAAITRIPGHKTVIFDSISMLLVYNDAEIVGQFMNFIINKMRLQGVDIDVLSLKSDASRNVVATIAAIVDEVKEVGE
ncbi:hypothetical protein HY493_00710 [Candidatus Woesearchaeota archaeon]|nr:hypothetical protein [Candidatus Woesearchaeota archaeon]